MTTARTKRMMDSLPGMYSDSRIMEAIQAAIADELDYQEGLHNDLRSQLYIQTATWGLKYWEYPLGIKTNENDSYEIRRSRVLAAWRGLSSQFSASLVRSICEAFSGGEVSVSFPRSLTNLVTNGDFSNGTAGWVGTRSTLSAADHTLTATHNGTGGLPSNDAYSVIGNKVVGSKYYVRAKVRVTNDKCLSLSLATSDIAKYLTNPVQNQWYTLEGIITATSNYQYVLIQQNYADVATASGKSMEVQYVMVINLSEDFGATTTPTLAQVNEQLKDFPNSWFNGTANRDNTMIVKFIGARGIPENMEDLVAAVEKVTHAHIGIEYKYTYLSWDELDAAAKTWDQVDAMGLTWDTFETWKP